jgi:hypothetical protein
MSMKSKNKVTTLASTNSDSSNIGSIPKTSGKKYFYGWTIAIVCLLLIAYTYGVRLSYGVFIKSLETDFGWTRTLSSGIFQFICCSGVFLQ